MLSGKIIDRFRLDDKEIVFRYPRFEDVDQLMSFINSFIKERAYLGTQKPVTRKKEIAWVTEMLKQIEEGRRVSVVLELDGRICGMSDASLNSLDAKKHVASTGIGVAKEARGFGLGKRLMTVTEGEARKRLKVKILELFVFKRNRRAYDLYRSMGYEDVGTIKNGLCHFGRYVDEILMVKYLRPAKDSSRK